MATIRSFLSQFPHNFSFTSTKIPPQKTYKPWPLNKTSKTSREVIYCMMEVLSVNNTPGFDEFSSKMAKFWMDNFQARPHWAKLWEHIPGIVPYLRRQASERFDRFEAIRKKYDPNGMFMNATFAGVLGH